MSESFCSRGAGCAQSCFAGPSLTEEDAEAFRVRMVHHKVKEELMSFCNLLTFISERLIPDGERDRVAAAYKAWLQDKTDNDQAKRSHVLAVQIAMESRMLQSQSRELAVRTQQAILTIPESLSTRPERVQADLRDLERAMEEVETTHQLHIIAVAVLNKYFGLGAPHHWSVSERVSSFEMLDVDQAYAGWRESLDDLVHAEYDQSGGGRRGGKSSQTVHRRSRAGGMVAFAGVMCAALACLAA